MGVSYSEVKSFLEKREGDALSTLRSLEENIIKGRDREDVPVYLTKYRVKSVDSLFLKTKRKNIEDLDKITDYAGIRIICLFEQDLEPVNDYLINILKSQGYSLSEFNIYNFPEKHFVKKLVSKIEERYSGFNTDKAIMSNKESGYRSIHYVVSRVSGGIKYNIEIQLRTLLQDAWSELEHSLAYKKGTVHPHVKKSFYLLSQELATKDLLVKHLKSIADKEKLAEQFALERTGPYKIFWYDERLLPSIFSNPGKKEKFECYKKIANSSEKDVDYVSKARDAYDLLVSDITKQELDDSMLNYWVEIEHAYLLFHEKKYDDALVMYQSIVVKHPGFYVPHFRIGEINFINGEIEKSLVAFDDSESILSMKAKEVEECVNTYRLKVKLANVYWLLGPEYYDIALREIYEAEEIFIENRKLFLESDRVSLLNNLCWYTLEMYLIKRTASNFKVVRDRFDDLQPILSRENISSNSFDTASWFCYHAYLRTSKKKWKEHAINFCQKAWGHKPAVTHTISSVNIHRNHTTEIMSCK